MRRSNSLQFGAPSTPQTPTRYVPGTPVRSDHVQQVQGLGARQLSPSRGVRPTPFNRNSSDNVAAILGGSNVTTTPSPTSGARPATKQSFRDLKPGPQESGPTALPPFDCKVLQSAGKVSSKPINLFAGAGSTQGMRPTMEDSHLALINAGTASDGNPVSLFAVLDGHCGRRVADLGTHFLPEALLSRPTLGTDNATAFVEAVMQTDRAIFQQMGRTDGGSTLIAGLVHNRMLFVANLGDARAVLYDGSTIAMSTDHKPTDTLEQQRIVRCGSFVHFGRVGACLAVSRALGDFEFKFNGNRYGTEKEFAVGNVPDICQINITDTTQFLILACDGLWDVCSNEESTAFVNSFVASADTKDFNRTLNLCATQLAIHAVERGSMDNVTVLLVWFHDPPVTLAPTTSPTAQPTSVVNGNPSNYSGYGVGSSNPNPSTPKAGFGRPPSQGARANSVGAGFSRTAPMGVANRLPSLATPKRGNL